MRCLDGQRERMNFMFVHDQPTPYNYSTPHRAAA
jgi:hypothetical protein